MIVGDYAFRCHEDREIGFRAYLRTRLSGGCSRRRRKGRGFSGADPSGYARSLRRAPGDAAVYNVANGNLGLASALEELGHANDVIVVTHEANRITIPLLKKGTMDLESILSATGNVEMTQRSICLPPLPAISPTRR